jgi:hypothetical protein
VPSKGRRAGTRAAWPVFAPAPARNPPIFPSWRSSCVSPAREWNIRPAMISYIYLRKNFQCWPLRNMPKYISP